MENKYIDNEVFKFRVCLKWNLRDENITVYTKPFPTVPDSDFRTQEQLETLYDDEERIVQEKYFTQQKIDELKSRLIQRIQESDNPFDICCVDRDSGYNVTEEDLFNLD